MMKKPRKIQCFCKMEQVLMPHATVIANKMIGYIFTVFWEHLGMKNVKIWDF